MHTSILVTKITPYLSWSLKTQNKIKAKQKQNKTKQKQNKTKQKQKQTKNPSKQNTKQLKKKSCAQANAP